MREALFGREFLVAIFDDEHGLVDGARAVRASGFRIYDAFTPYPIHNLDAAMGIRRSRLPIASLAGGLLGLLTTFAFEWYAAAVDWPLNVGGKPDVSTLAFIPIAFELTILGAALGAAVAFLVRCRLFPGNRARGADLGATGEAFALVLRWRDTSFDAHHAGRLLYEAGAREVRRRGVDL